MKTILQAVLIKKISWKKIICSVQSGETYENGYALKITKMSVENYTPTINLKCEKFTLFFATDEIHFPGNNPHCTQSSLFRSITFGHVCPNDACLNTFFTGETEIY